MALSKLPPIHERIPDDILLEILSQLEPDDLSACLCVNRKFNDIIRDPGFKSCQTKTLSRYLTHDDRTYSFVPDEAMKGATDVGLSKFEAFDKVEILCQRYMMMEAVSQCRDLICCVNDFETAATAVVASLSRQEFKIVRFSLPHGRSLYLRCEVFDSHAWRWHGCNNIKEDIRFPSDWRRDGVVFVQGSIHWLTQQGIFAFNMYNETWKWIDLPPDYADFERNHRAKITMQDGKLSLVHVKDDAKVVVWRSDNYIEAKQGSRQVVNFMRSRHEDNRLRSFQELFYSSSSGLNCLFNNNWEGVWKANLGALDANKSFIGGDVFRFESDATPCKALQQIA